jgi:hypothetical protein
MQEFQMVLEIGQIRRQAILDARTEALDVVPGAQAALEVYNEALQAAERACTADYDAAHHACQMAEIDAHTKHGDANVAVMSALQEDNARAENDCRAATEECEQVYQAAWNEALQMVGPAADKARKTARAAREKALAACEKARTKALAAADTKYQKALFKNNETMIAETDAAQNAKVEAEQVARDKRDKAQRVAAAALGKTLGADAGARAVEADFSGRLQKDQEDFEREKAAVWERMRVDLAGL